MSDINVDALNWIKEHGAPQIHTSQDGEESAFYGGKKYPIERVKFEGVSVSTLSGLARFVCSSLEALPLESFAGIVVCTPAVVKWVSSEGVPHREHYAQAVYPHEKMSHAQLGLDGALLWLATGCQVSADQEQLIEILSDVEVTDTKVKRRKGLGWSVSAERGGSAGTPEHQVDKPYFNLRPWSTFPEAAEEQPEQLYYVQLQPTAEGANRADVVVSFTPAHGDAWRAKASETVGARMQEELLKAANAMVATDRTLPQVVW